jgi:hypothetical protein
MKLKITASKEVLTEKDIQKRVKAVEDLHGIWMDLPKEIQDMLLNKKGDEDETK